MTHKFVNMEDLTERLDRMGMATQAGERLQMSTNEHHNRPPRHRADITNTYNIEDYCNENEAIYDNRERRMSIDGENMEPACVELTGRSESNQYKAIKKNGGSILIVTNVDQMVFQDPMVKAKFESLFRAYDERLQFRYLKSFRRVRLDFTTAQAAELARVSMNNYKLCGSSIKCYLAQMIRPNGGAKRNDVALDRNDTEDQDENDDDIEGADNPYRQSGNFLDIPKRTKQFLLSPPVSPPEGWVPREEATPCIDVQLISALANLVPGKMHEIHEGNESQPHIFVEVCEEIEQDPSLKSMGSARGRIPKTPSPHAAAAPPV